MPEVGHQSGLGRLIFRVAPQVIAAQAVAQTLLGVGKEVFSGVCRTLHKGLCSASAIANDQVLAHLFSV